MTRHSLVGALAVAIALTGCHAGDIAPPELRRPIESVPSGARVLVLASDLRNTWQRVEAHDLLTLAESWPGLAEVAHDSALVHLRERCREFETRTGASLRDDLLLNLIGDRAALAVYPAASREHDLLVVAELHDAPRFRAVLDSLRAVRPPGGGSIRPDTLDGRPVWRLEDRHRSPFTIVVQDRFAVVATTDDLARRALAMHAGGGEGSALHDPELRAALDAVGLHNVVALTVVDNGVWAAAGWTWDRDGLHFDQMASVPAAASVSAGRKESIWRSLPEGMAVVGCIGRHAVDWRGLGSKLRLGAADRAASPFEATGLPMAGWPALDRDWMGDAVGVAVRGVEVTTVAPIPDVALVVEVRDAAAAAADLRSVEAQLAALRFGGGSASFTDVHYGGRTYRTLVQPFSDRISPSWVVDGDVAVLATTRSLLEQILDTRRTGRRTARSDGAFRRFDKFAPSDAGAVFYANERRMHDAAQKLREAHGLWGPGVERGIAMIEQWSSVAAHFPSGVAYLARRDSTLVLRGWMSEAD